MRSEIPKTGFLKGENDCIVFMYMAGGNGQPFSRIGRLRCVSGDCCAWGKIRTLFFVKPPYDFLVNLNYLL